VLDRVALVALAEGLRANLRSKVLDPAGAVVGAVRALGLSEPPPSTLVLADWATRMGLDLFYPPNVGG
jgi:hypothetical protein